MRLASSKKEALFETWLLDGIYLKEGGKHKILQVDEAKNAIKDLVEKEDYDVARKLAEGLRGKISISNREILRSFRLSFPAYVHTVQMAFEKETSLSSIIKDYIEKDITQIIDSMQKRKIPGEKRELIKETFKEWKGQLTVRSSYKREKYTLSLALGAEDIPDEIARVCQTEFLKKVRSEFSKIPEVLDRYLLGIGIKETEEKDELFNVKFNPQLFEIHLSPSEDKRLQISLSFTNFLSSFDMSEAEFAALDDELRKDFGDEAVHELFEVHEGFFSKEGPFFEVELFSGTIELRDGKPFLNDVEIVSYPTFKNHDYDKFKEILLKDYDLNVVQLKMDLEKLLREDQYNKIVEITEKLSNMKTRRTLADFSLEVIAKLLRRKTQVISFRAPEILIVMWEAKKPNRFESLLGVQDQ